MPKVKFSDFSVESTVNDSHYVLGYYGTSNKRWTMQTLKNRIAELVVNCFQIVSLTYWSQRIA